MDRAGGATQKINSAFSVPLFSTKNDKICSFPRCAQSRKNGAQHVQRKYARLFKRHDRGRDATEKSKNQKNAVDAEKSRFSTIQS